MEAPILEFTLQMTVRHAYSKIDEVIVRLSRNHTIKKLTFHFHNLDSYGVPLSFFLLHHLTDLKLEECDIDEETTFNGFGSLTRLSLIRLCISRKTLLRLLSNCPSLKSLELFLLDEFLDDELPNIMELFKSLPVIEHLTTWGYITPSFVLDAVPQGPPTSLFHLKYFCFKEMGIAYCSGMTFGLTFLLVLLKCSPNLEKIKLEMDTYEESDDEEPIKMEECSAIFEKYSDVWLEHLHELKIQNFITGRPGEIELVKFILARSPRLKKVILIIIDHKKEEFELLHILLRAPRASPVEIFVERSY